MAIRVSPLCRVAVLPALLLFFSADIAAGAIVSTTNAEETTLEAGAGRQNTNRANDIIVVGNSGGAGRRHSLITFGDIGPLVGGSGQTINSATMRLNVQNVNGNAPGNLIGVFAATTPWTEGTGDSSSSGGSPFGATWNAAKREGADGIGEGDPGDTDSPINWTTAGGDYVGNPVLPFATATVVTEGLETYYDFDVTALVQAWYSGALTNNGMILTPLTTDSSAFSRVSFNTSDKNSPGDEATTFPRLTIAYNVPEPCTGVLSAIALIGWAARRRFAAGRRNPVQV